MMTVDRNTHAFALAERDAIENGFGYILQATEGDIRVHPDDLSVSWQDGNRTISFRGPVPLKMTEDKWVTLAFDGGDVTVRVSRTPSFRRVT